MQARFLLGPAGSGKTFRCLAEIRSALRESPEGPPLILLAPKQATFQLERQLLADGSLGGYTRLQILSFDRLARFFMTEFTPASANWLDDEGRIMVLRALLAQKQSQLKLFRSTARLPGFATRLSGLLRELQRHQISPDRLLALAEKITQPAQLHDKLHDFSLLLRGYLDWLREYKLGDADSILDSAAAFLKSCHQPTAASRPLRIAGLWLDGFAEMTAQELDLLAALVPLCDHAALAFCLETEPTEEPSWLSTWSVIGQTYLRCRQRIADLPNAKVSVEILGRDPSHSRFAQSAELAHLEKSWSASTGLPSSILHPPSSIFLASCANPEAEAVLAAREIRRFVRNGGRFREAAVMVRSLDDYAHTLRRVFERYNIPCFLDRREPAAHHPLAELTRYALRTVAFGWRQADWFGALKTGLVPARDEDIDWLENAALEFGWDGNTWRQPLAVPGSTALSERAEHLRQQFVPAFLTLAKRIESALTGVQLADALREFWNTLGVEKTLEDWTASANKNSAPRTASAERCSMTVVPASHSAFHLTVFDEMHAWLDNLERAFPTEAVSARDWLPILEAGLSNLTVGVIPPALDQVLIGAIDRSRSPELKLALVLGLNEGVFPAPPAEDPLLTELERDALMLQGAKLGPSTKHRVGHEWFYGYIACTRASERLILTCAQFDARGNKLNRSPFFDHLEKLFPGLKLADWQPPQDFSAVEHVSEIITPAIQLQAGRGTPGASSDGLLALPELADVLGKARHIATANANPNLAPASVEALYGRKIGTSVSGLEDFAACPYKFFISRGLRAEERKRFELDARERGSFQHEVLTIFHTELATEQRKWREVPADEARERVRRIGQHLLTGYRHGLFTTDAARRFTGEMLLASLETLVTVLVEWARDYKFDPELVETGFGLPSAPWPAWKLDAGDGRALFLRGRIDRVDVWRDSATGAALAVVMDYKSSSRKPDKLKLHHGLQLQLPAYLAALGEIPTVLSTLGVKSIAPAGVFYVNLRGEFFSARSRSEVLEDSALGLREGFQHFGRYDTDHLKKFDPHGKGEQFKTHYNSYDRMDSTAFRDLLKRTVDNLQRFGREIFSGKIAPEPFRKGHETACDFCEYSGICRFDAWTQPFRTLKPPEEKT